MTPASAPIRPRLVAVMLIAAAASAAGGPGAALAQPPISAPNAIVVEATTGDVAYERAADQPRPIASATKLMTALLALERANLSEAVPAARYRALPVESKIGLRTGEALTVADLMRGLLLGSANDAAVTLAEHVAGTRAAFVREMNARARELGLTRTRFANPIGLDAPGNRSTARDLAALTLELRRNSFFRRTVDRPVATLESGSRTRTVINRNRLVRRVPWIDGVKTGHTQGAGYVLIGSGRRRGVPLVSVVLGTPSEAAREADTLALLRFGFTRFRRVAAVRRGQVFARVPIRFRGGARLSLVASRTVRRVIRRGRSFSVRTRDVPAEVEGRIREGQRMGSVEIRRGTDVVTRVALVAATDVPAAGFGRRSQEYLTRPQTLVLLALAIGASVLLALLRRRVTRARDARHGEVSAA